MTSRHCVATLLLALVGSLGVVAPAVAQEPAEAAQASPEDLARQLMGLTGGGELGKQVMAQMVASFRGMDSSVPEEFWQEFLDSVDAEQLVEMIVPIYVRHLTVEEMTAAIEFYSSPVGQSLIRKLPAIMAESMSAGQAWGEELAGEVVEKLERYRQEHPET
jgi:hypothetical protein